MTAMATQKLALAGANLTVEEEAPRSVLRARRGLPIPGQKLSTAPSVKPGPSVT